MKKKVSRKPASGEAQNRCIWMTAGVISFKLCPINYDCEHCDFDKAIRSQVKSKRTRSKAKRSVSKTLVPLERDPKEALPFFTFSAGDVEEGLYLHPAHLWVHEPEDGKWRIGIGKLLAYVLPSPLQVELRNQNTMIIQNQLVGKVRTQAGIVPLIAPLSGVLSRANPILSERPELVQHDPSGEGWLVEIDRSQDQSGLDSLYTGLEGIEFLKEEAQHLNFLLKHRGIEVNNIGETLPDGGASIKYLHQVLPSQVCLGLACELTLSGKQTW